MDPLLEKLKSFDWAYPDADDESYQEIKRRIAAAGKKRRFLTYSQLGPKVLGGAIVLFTTCLGNILPLCPRNRWLLRAAVYREGGASHCKLFGLNTQVLPTLKLGRLESTNQASRCLGKSQKVIASDSGDNQQNIMRT